MESHQEISALPSSSMTEVKRPIDGEDLVSAALSRAYKLRSEMLTSVMSRPTFESSSDKTLPTYPQYSALNIDDVSKDYAEPILPPYALVSDDSPGPSSLSSLGNEEISDPLDSLPDDLAAQNILLGPREGHTSQAEAATHDMAAKKSTTLLEDKRSNSQEKNLEKGSASPLKEKSKKTTLKIDRRVTPAIKKKLDNLHFIKFFVFSLHLDNSGGSDNKPSKYSVVRGCRTRTYLVELFLPFPTNLPSWDICGRKIDTKEPLKFWSRTEKHNVILFQQELSVPVVIDETDLDWLDAELLFKISVRPYRRKETTVLGFCSVKIPDLLKHSTLEESLPLRPAEDGQQKSMLDNHSSTSFLKVKISLNSRKGSISETVKQSPKSKAPKTTSDEEKRKETSKAEMVQFQPITIPKSPVRVVKHQILPSENIVDVSTSLVASTKPYYLLLRIIEGKFNQLTGPSSFYVICHNIKDTSQSEVCWETTHPQFYFTQIVPLVLNTEMLQSMCDRLVVIEVWQKVGCIANDDKLVGLVKLPLRTFYIAFSDPVLAISQTRSEYPVIGADGYFAVINPFTSQRVGNLKALLALGSWVQIDQLLSRNEYTRHDIISSSSTDFCHTFQVFLESINKLEIRKSQISGSECILAYTFPSMKDSPSDLNRSDDVILKKFTTDSRVLAPNMNLMHRNEISFYGPENAACLLFQQKVQGLGFQSNGLMFILQNSNSHSNKVLAKGHLGWNTMERLALQCLQCHAAVSQTFVLPMYPPEEDEFSTRDEIQEVFPCGYLRLSISYYLMSTEVKKDAVIQVDASSELHDDFQGPEVVPEISGHAEKDVDDPDKQFFDASTQIGASLILSKDSSHQVNLGQYTSSSVTPTTIPKCIERTADQEIDTAPISPPTFTADIIIERALHLPEVTNTPIGESVPPSSYVSFQWGAEKQHTLMTPVAERSVSPVWEWRKEVTLNRFLLLPDSKGLVFKVWLTDMRNRKSQVKTSDKLLGTCTLILSPLAHGLSAISGWYNILDVTGKCCGQLKVSVIPEENLQAQFSECVTKGLFQSHFLKADAYPHQDVVLHNTLVTPGHKNKLRAGSASSSGSYASRRRSFHQPVGCSSNGTSCRSSQVNSQQSSPQHSSVCCLLHGRRNDMLQEAVMKGLPVASVIPEATSDIAVIRERLRQQISELDAVSMKLQRHLYLQKSKSEGEIQVLDSTQNRSKCLGFGDCSHLEKFHTLRLNSSSGILNHSSHCGFQEAHSACKVQSHCCCTMLSALHHNAWCRGIKSSAGCNSYVVKDLSSTSPKNTTGEFDITDSALCSANSFQPVAPSTNSVNVRIDKHSDCSNLFQRVRKIVPLSESHLNTFRTDADGLSDRGSTDQDLQSFPVVGAINADEGYSASREPVMQTEEVVES